VFCVAGGGGNVELEFAANREPLKLENRKSKIENRKSKIENRKSKIENRKSKIENRKSKIENRKSSSLQGKGNPPLRNYVYRKKPGKRRREQTVPAPFAASGLLRPA
jgi:hypothetical protein